MNIAILKTAALGDVVRTTSILPGLHRRYGNARVTWVTAPSALDLVRTNPHVERVLCLDQKDPASVALVEAELDGTSFERVLSFDDEPVMCALATRLAGDRPESILSGAYLDGVERVYTKDCAPWFDMGLLSVHGKEEADRLKRENRETHPSIFARMLKIGKGEPELHLTEEAQRFGASFRAQHEWDSRRPVVGLNTGSGGRWESKKLSVERTIETARLLDEELAQRPLYVLMGGPEEEERNARIAQGLESQKRPLAWIDGGTKNSLLEFAALVDDLDLLVTSDSLALHIATARSVPIVAFFAPTPAAEIDFYGRGQAVESTADDYASYRKDADTSSLTPERLTQACVSVLKANVA